MNYIKFFGSHKEQSDSIIEMEKEVFLRKVVMVGAFSDVLRESGIALFLQAGESYRKLKFEVEKCGVTDQGDGKIHNLIDLIMYCNTCYGLEDDFVDKYNVFLNVLIVLEDKMEVKHAVDINVPFKILVDSASIEWLKIVFESCDKKELYHLFMKQILQQDLFEKKISNKTLKI